MSSDLATEDPEPKKSYRQILREEILEGRRAMERPLAGIFLSSVSAGLEIGFSLFMMAVVHTRLGGELSPGVLAAVVANMYAIGFIFVTLGRSELFTEHTTLAVLPVLGRHATVLELGRLWLVVYVGNLCGVFAFAALTVLIGPMLGVIEPRALAEIARPVVAHSGEAMLLSAVLAGWAMGLLSWLVTAARDTISQIVIVWLIAAMIGFAHLHHAIVGSVEVLAGVFAGQGVTMAEYGRFLGWTTLGNALGGVFFVALLKFSHATQGTLSRETEPIERQQTNQERGRPDENRQERRAS